MKLNPPHLQKLIQISVVVVGDSDCRVDGEAGGCV